MIETPQDRYKAYTKALIEACRIFEDAYDDLAVSFKAREMKALLQVSENLYDATTGMSDVLTTLIANLKQIDKRVEAGSPMPMNNVEKKGE